MNWQQENIPTQKIAGQPIIILISTTKRFTERHQSIAQQLATANLVGQHITQFEPETIDEHIRGRQRPDLDLSTAKLSNLHKQMWAQFALAHHPTAKYCLLLEDDALLTPNFRTNFEQVLNATVELNPSWIISLGGFDDKRDLKAARPNPLLIEQPITTAEGYLFDQVSARTRYAWFKEHGVVASNDHQLQLSSVECEITQYMVLDPLVYQGSASGKFRTTMDGFRQRKSSTFLTLRFYWNALRKRYLPRLLHRYFG